MYLKIHNPDGPTIAALCDADVLGKVFCEGELVLDLKAYSSFYKGEKVGEQKAIAALQNADSLNLVGKKAVALAERLGLVEKARAKTVAGVPHVQVYRI